MNTSLGTACISFCIARTSSMQSTYIFHPYKEFLPLHYTFIARLTRTPPLITKITAYKRALCHIITHIFSQSAYIFGHPYSDSSTRSMNPFICTNQHSPQQSVDTVHTEYLTVAATLPPNYTAPTHRATATPANTTAVTSTTKS